MNFSRLHVVWLVWWPLLTCIWLPPLLWLVQAAAFLQAQPHRTEASLLGGSMQLGTFGSNGGSSSRTSLELDDGSLDPSAAAAIRGLNRSSNNREQQQRQAERQPAVHAAAGSSGINPLVNAIDMSPSAHAAASKVGEWG
jgi:hypothetical protein